MVQNFIILNAFLHHRAKRCLIYCSIVHCTHESLGDNAAKLSSLRRSVYGSGRHDMEDNETRGWLSQYENGVAIDFRLLQARRASSLSPVVNCSPVINDGIMISDFSSVSLL